MAISSPKARFSMTENGWRLTIAALSAAVLLITVWCLVQGITVIFMHLYYFPIVLLAYRYRWKGFYYASLLALTYLILVSVFYPAPAEIAGAVFRVLVFGGIAAVIAALSEQLRTSRSSELQSRALNEQYLALAPAIVLVLDRTGAITYLNENGCRILACEAASAVGKSWVDTFIPPGEQESIRALFLGTMNDDSGRYGMVEGMVVSGRGDLRYIRWYNTILRDPEGAASGILSFGEDITEEKRTKDALQEVQEFQESVIANANVWIAVLAPDGTVLVWNKAAERISGYAGEAVTGMNTVWKQMYPDPEYRRGVTREIQGVLSRDTGLTDFETRIRCADGTTKTIIWNTKGLRDREGKVTSYIVIGRDITAQKDAEQKAGENARFLATMLDTLPMPVFYKDQEGRYLGCNPPFEEYLGIRKEDIIGKSEYDIAPEEFADRYAQADRQVFSHPVPQRYETQVRYADGTLHDVIFSKAPFFSKDGSVAGLIGAFLDITERKRSEEALRKSEVRFRTMADWTYDWEYWIDLNREVLYVSPSVERITGYRADEFIADKGLIDRIIHPDDRSLWESHTPFHVQDGPVDKPAEIEFRILARDGTLRWIGHTCRAIHAEDGSWLGRRISNRDITDRKTAEDRIRVLLRVQEEQLRIINASPAVSFLWRAEENWPVESVSTSIAQFGYTPDDFLSGRILFGAIIHPDDLARVGAEVSFNSTHAIDDYTQIYRIRGKDGTEYWIEDYTHIRRDESGRITHYEGLVLDISDRKRASIALKETNDYLTSLFDYANAPIIVWDPSFHITRFNHAFEHLTGRTEQEVIGQPLAILFPAGSREELLEQLRETLAGVRWESVEIPVLHVSGEVRTVLWNSAPLYGDDGDTVIATIAQGQDITERKEMETALSLSHQTYRSYIDNSPIGIFVADSAGKYLDVNDAALHLLGYSREEMMSMTVLDLALLEERQQIRDQFISIQEQLKTEPSVSFELRLKKKDGSACPVILSTTRLPNHTILGFTLDITERKAAEKALHESRQLFANIISFLPDPTFVIDNDGTVVAWNRAIEQLSGIPAAAMIGQGDYAYSVWVHGKRRPILIDLVLDPDKDSARIHYTDIRWEGSTVTALLEVTLPGREKKVPLSLVASPLFDAEGKVAGAIESMRDISRLMEAEEELERFNANLEKIIRDRTRALNDEIVQRKAAEREVADALRYTQSLIEANPDLMIIFDDQGNVLDVNPAAESLTGLSREALVGSSYSRYLVDDATPKDIVSRLLHEGQVEYTVNLRRADGHVTPVSVNATIFRGENGAETRIIVAGHDISRQKENEAALQAALDEQVLLLREVHHRVKNNLQIIISLTNLQMRQSTDPGVKEIMAETQNRVRAMSLVHEKLYRSQSLSKIDFGDYSRFLATQLFAYYGMDTKRVQLEFAVEKIMVDIVTAVPLGLLMNELVSNAFRHAFPGGRSGTIGISGRCEGDTITLTVWDNGVGIPPDLDWKNTGTLGLRLVNTLVDQVDGTIELDRSSGTRYTITVRRPPGDGGAA